MLLATPAAEMIGTLIQPFDPLAYGVGLSLIIATCLIAAFVPARRAAHISPIAPRRLSLFLRNVFASHIVQLRDPM